MSASAVKFPLYDDDGNIVGKTYVPKCTLDFDAVPGVGDDDADGFVAGSFVVNRTTDTIYDCLDNTTGAAVWTARSGSTVSANWKSPVRVATAASGTLGSSFENGDTVDGITLATGDRILIFRQVTATQNGIYTVNASGSPTRATDADTGAEIWKCSFVVQEGTMHGGTLFHNTNTSSPTIGATNLTFEPVGVAAIETTSTDHGIVRWDGTGANQVQDSGVTIDDSDNVTIPGTVSASDLTSGVYTPTLYNTTNVAASTAYQCQYMRVGSVVTVSGKVDIDPTAAAQTLLGMDLPIASNIGADEDVGGSASCSTFQQDAAIFGDAANNRASFHFLVAAVGGAANLSYGFSFTYRII